MGDTRLGRFLWGIWTRRKGEGGKGEFGRGFPYSEGSQLACFKRYLDERYSCFRGYPFR